MECQAVATCYGIEEEWAQILASMAGIVKAAFIPVAIRAFTIRGALDTMLAVGIWTRIQDITVL